MPNYLTRDYFADTYFRQIDPVQPSPGGTAASRDRDAYEAIVARLRASGAFAAVAFPGGPAAGPGLPAGVRPSAVLVPGLWSQADDAEAGARLRTVEYALLLELRDVQASRACDRLDRLAGRAQDMLDGTDLGGLVEPGLSRLGQGRPDPKSKPPWARLALQGRFSYRVLRRTIP